MRVSYSRLMATLLQRRFWALLVAALFLLGTSLPIVAAYAHPSALACADMAIPGKPGCSGSATKAIACNMAACAGLVAELPNRVAHSEAAPSFITFSPALAAMMFGAAWPPEPFPPRPPRSS